MWALIFPSKVGKMLPDLISLSPYSFLPNEEPTARFFSGSCRFVITVALDFSLLCSALYFGQENECTASWLVTAVAWYISFGM